MNQQQKPLRGIKIQVFNGWMIFIACVLFALIFYVTAQVSGRYRALIAATEEYMACEEDAAQIRAGSDYLTEQVRLYIITAKREYMENYFAEANVTRRRDGALEHLHSYFQDETGYKLLQSALDASNRLMERETYAMKLISAANGYEDATLPPEVAQVSLSREDAARSSREQTQQAEGLVFDLEYQDAKNEIYGDISLFLNEVARYTGQNQLDTSRNLERSISLQRLLVSLLFLMNVLTFIFIAVLVVQPLKICIKRIKENSMFELIGSYEFKYLALTYNSIYEVNAANQASLKKQAEQDSLTGLFNRSAFFREADRRAREGNSVALLMADIHRLQDINDSFSYDTGDLVLKKVARILAVEFRSTDIPARLGDDEFAVLMVDVTPEQQPVIEKKVQRINSLLQNPEDGLPPVSLRVGVAFSPLGYTKELYEKADHALHRMKEAGERGCRFDEEIGAVVN